MSWRCERCGETAPDGASGYRDAACARCGAAMRFEEGVSVAWRCPTCGRALEATATRCGACSARDGGPKAATGRCPACGVGLCPRNFGEAEVLVCGVCNGMMVPNSVLRGWMEGRARQAPEDVPAVVFAHDWSVHYRRCPSCVGMMNRMNFAPGTGVIVDRCQAHGYWLDAGELERIVAYVRQNGLAGTAIGRAEERRRDDARPSAPLDLTSFVVDSPSEPVAQRLGRALLALLGWD